MEDKVIFSPGTFTDYISWKLFQERTLFIAEDIYDNTAEGICGQLEALVVLSEEPITIIITSPGGSVFAALAIYDTITKIRKENKIIIKAEARGYAASAAAIILQAADIRSATLHTRLLIHEVSSFKFLERERASDAEEDAKELNKVNDMVANILAERSNHSLEEIKKLWKKTDVWMSAEEAKEWNLIDSII